MKEDLLYKTIKRQIEELAAAAPPDASLPSENRFSAKFGASRMTVRKALGELEAEGKLRRIQGKGTYPAGFPHASSFAERCAAFVAPSISSKFSDDIAQGMTTFCRDNSTHFITLLTRNSRALEKEQLDMAVKLGCCGIVFMPIDDSGEDYLTTFERDHPHIPVVFADRKRAGSRYGYVGSDHYAIGYTAVKYLAEKGHKNIAFPVAEYKPTSMLDRIAGYKDAVSRFTGGGKSYYAYRTLFSIPAENYYCDFFQKYPQLTAVISASGHPADDIAAALLKLNKSVPKDFSILLVDEESPNLGRVFHTDIPVIVQNGFKIGYAALEELFALLVHNASPRDVFIPFNLQLI
ncbi:hypothetical protein FACS1894211_00700 [Clostridia bacterium]|nr:hypothetical protein FACS1894211_00700 [Clostridia bacterium]